MEYTTDGILQELETQLSSKSSWRKTLFYGTYRRLNTVVAYIINKFVYLTEFFYKESSWDLATQRDSLMSRVEYYWYNPYRKVGASGYVQIIADPTWEINNDPGVPYVYTGADVIIPQWAVFTDENNEVFVYSVEQKIYYKHTESYIEIPVKEGVPKQYIYIAKGLNNEQIVLNFNNIDNDEVYVYILDENDEIIHTVFRCEKDVEDKLFFINDLDNYYCSIKNSLSMNSIIITFGDGTKSRALTLNERVLIKYAETKGVAGNITNSDVINKIYTPLVNADGNDANIFARNLEAITNASDEEDIESIRFNAPNLFNSGYRAGGYDDWKVILESDSRIYKAMVWSTDDYADDTITSNQNKIFIVAIGADGNALTISQQNNITINLLKPLKSVTEIASWQPLKKIYARFSITATIEDILNTTAQLKINTNLMENYGTLYTDFKKNIYQSEFGSVISDTLLEGTKFIINHVTDIYHLEKDNILYGLFNYTIVPSVLSTENSNTIEQIYLLPGTIELWVRIKDEAGDYGNPIRVGYESGISIIGDNGYTIIDSFIIHSQNSISYFITDLESVDISTYELVLIYKTQNGDGLRTNDIRLPYFDIITDFDDAYNVFNLSYE